MTPLQNKNIKPFKQIKFTFVGSPMYQFLYFQRDYKSLGKWTSYFWSYSSSKQTTDKVK